MSGSDLASAGAGGVTRAGVVFGRARDARADGVAERGDARRAPVLSSPTRLSALGTLQCDERDRGHAQPDDSEKRCRRLDQSATAPASGGRGVHGRQAMGADLGQTSIPSRRAERCRWRLARSRRSRLTSIGSAASAAGVSISAFSTW